MSRREGAAPICLLRVILSCGVVIYGVSAIITCKDKNDDPIDWFIVYKIPHLHKSTHKWISEGLGHMYMDVNSQHWQLSNVSLNQSGHAIYNTLQQIYNNPKSQDVAFLLYNDETPDGKTTYEYGHSKGDVCFDKKGGFWLVHSLPKFPRPANEGYTWPHNGLTYGQAFICVTYPYATLNAIGKQLMYNNPLVYDYNLPADLAKDNPNLVSAANMTPVSGTVYNNSVTLSSSAGQKFISFAKYKKFNADLYSAWLAPYFGSNMVTETWQNGRGKSPSSCQGHTVENIKMLHLPYNVSFKETKDHSKWGITTSAGKQWTCIGDINRMETQHERSGGTVCFNLPSVWKAFSSAVYSVEKCPAGRIL